MNKGDGYILLEAGLWLVLFLVLLFGGLPILAVTSNTAIKWGCMQWPSMTIEKRKPFTLFLLFGCCCITENCLVIKNT